MCIPNFGIARNLSNTINDPHAAILAFYIYKFTLLLCYHSTAFSPKSETELSDAVNACLELSPEGDCSDGRHGPMVSSPEILFLIGRGSRATLKFEGASRKP